MALEPFSLDRFRELGSDVNLLEYRNKILAPNKIVNFFVADNSKQPNNIYTWSEYGVEQHYFNGHVYKDGTENIHDLFLRIPDKVVVSYANVYPIQHEHSTEWYDNLIDCTNNADTYCVGVIEVTYNETTGEVTTKIIKP